MDFLQVPQQDFGPVAIGGAAPMLLIAGPCVIESRQHCLDMAEALQKLSAKHQVPLIFKASFDKANRSKFDAFRGPGLEAGLEILSEVKQRFGLPLLTDVHQADQAALVAAVVDVLQIPAFLCRQTDLIAACAATGKPVNLKKGQFLAPHDAGHMLDKAKHFGAQAISITERGYTFGYNNLVVDMRGLAVLRQFAVPVIFDATHSVQLPGAAGGASGGERQHVAVLARAATAVGIDGLYVEVHDNPDQAKSDGPNALSLDMLDQLLPRLVQLDRLVTQRGAS